MPQLHKHFNVSANVVITSKKSKHETIYNLNFGLYLLLTTYGQVKVNPTGNFFNYNGVNIYYEDTGTGEPLLLLQHFFSTADEWKSYVTPQ